MQIFDNVDTPKAVLVATDNIDEVLACALNQSGIIVIAGGGYESQELKAQAEELIVLTRNIHENYPDIPVSLLGNDTGAFLAQYVVQKAAVEYQSVIFFNPVYIKGFRMRKLWFINKSAGIAAIPKQQPILIIAKDGYAASVDRLYNKYLEHALKGVVVKMHQGEIELEKAGGEILEFIHEQI